MQVFFGRAAQLDIPRPHTAYPNLSFYRVAPDYPANKALHLYSNGLGRRAASANTLLTHITERHRVTTAVPIRVGNILVLPRKATKQAISFSPLAQQIGRLERSRSLLRSSPRRQLMVPFAAFAVAPRSIGSGHKQAFDQRRLVQSATLGSRSANLLSIGDRALPALPVSRVHARGIDTAPLPAGIFRTGGRSASARASWPRS